ncbi:hypothetical protein PV325_005974 [Microctonus aethiopoides]|uniref:U3 small nucleolar RNA-associated protein 18 homolog n=1 Tax=Microctonus aethiopoides TaxID=144406 RepID=A0AA39FJT2_9HYME|nr:hypothetical protein PV325_005974 [Microctonus aethiopoides]KAK0096311.1 hypothetical protein PV326_005861 [Microctonus aethiopoides]KAK0170910.1 hypothetical protein PV328_008692 [Microctonus aethiopoides]
MSPPIAKKRKNEYDPEEEARLERIVFGDTNDVIKNLLKTKDENVSAEQESDNDTKSMSDCNDDDDDSKSDNDIMDHTASIDETEEKLKPAWIDEDDKYSVNQALSLQGRKLVQKIPEKTYNELLQNKFNQIVGTPKWAQLDKTDQDDGNDSDSEILKHSNHIVPIKTKKLAKGVIDIKALTEINKQTQNEGNMITSLQFHETSTVAFIAGLKGILSVFQIDGRENNKLQSIQFERFRINHAKFLKDGTEIIAGSRNHQYSQVYDLMSGKIYKCNLPYGVTNMKKFEVSPDGKIIAVAGRQGEIHLLTTTTKEMITTLKMNSKCTAMTFTPDSKSLVTHGDSEEIYVWDLNSRLCVHKAVDDGCISSREITISSSGQFLATGSKQGVVNIYETSSVLQSRYPKPLKIILNLVTPITSLKFNPTSEILAMASEYKENAFKMVHLPSFTVFSNFPTSRTTMHHALSIDFSPGSAYLGISNNKGNAYLYRLKHYGNY